MECQPSDDQSLGSLSGPCFVDRHDECQAWCEEPPFDIWGVRDCLCQRHIDNEKSPRPIPGAEGIRSRASLREGVKPLVRRPLVHIMRDASSGRRTSLPR
jgi:hypothetical protein